MAQFNHFVWEIFDENHKFNSLRSDQPPPPTILISFQPWLSLSLPKLCFGFLVLVTFLRQKWIIFIRCRFYGRPFILSIKKTFILIITFIQPLVVVYMIFFCCILLFRSCWARKMDFVICVSQRSIKYSTGFLCDVDRSCVIPQLSPHSIGARRVLHIKKRKDIYIHIYLSYFVHKTELPNGNLWRKYMTSGGRARGHWGGRANEYLYTYNNKPDSGSAVAFQKIKEIR